MGAVRMGTNLETECDASGVATVWLARPPVNAVDQAMYVQIAELFEKPDVLLPNVRCIVIAGRGPHFCAGNDLDEFVTMVPANAADRMRRVHAAFKAIQFCPVPVIAAVHGAALGTGVAIAASCDFIVAASSARFGLPELTVGVMGGARHLARLVAQPLVRRLFLTGESMTAETLASAGAPLVICDSSEVVEVARAYASRIAGFSPTATRLAKQVLNEIEEMDIPGGYAREQAATVRMTAHPDSKEALTAYLEKRIPVFNL